jgi:hypothetical protein
LLVLPTDLTRVFRRKYDEYFENKELTNRFDTHRNTKKCGNPTIIHDTTI